LPSDFPLQFKGAVSAESHLNMWISPTTQTGVIVHVMPGKYIDLDQPDGIQINKLLPYWKAFLASLRLGERNCGISGWA